jgi:catechol 2,3-dioxygenase-like lactoylglutathione lyase family enzyme
MIKKFWHAGVTVPDLNQAIEEYELLGFKLIERFDNTTPKAVAAHMEHADGSGVELWQWEDKDHPQVEFIKSHLAFESDSSEKDVARLIEQGCEVVIPRTEAETVTFTFVRDPSGNYIEIAEKKT